MTSPTLATKLYIPPLPPKVVSRPQLVERLNEGLHRKLTLISAPAGFGKSTLVSEWISGCERPVAWLSLDEEDKDPTRFLTYLVGALQTIAADIGAGALGLLGSPQPPSTESILTGLLNEITIIPGNFVLVLDDFHLIEAKPVDTALTFLIEHAPPQMHLVIATREDPHLPLARLRARGELTELRAIDLRFMHAEATAFLNQAMGLNLSPDDIAALETRTEGWITGLQLAAISMRGNEDASGFIKSFTGSHYFVLDYLMEEVLGQQPESIQDFLLGTSILDNLCGPLCDAVLRDAAAPGRETLEYLERSNLFIVPLDDERRWYRYHHLFADLLRQRLRQSVAPPNDDERTSVAELHSRASCWYEDNGLEIQAFQHAVAAGDIERATRLLIGKGMPLHVRGALVPVLTWLESLPPAELDKRPVLWVMYAGALTTAGLTTDVEQKLKAAEAALQGAEMDEETRDLLGRIASNRATLAITKYETDEVIVQANHALEYLLPENLPVRTIVMWALGVAQFMKGDRVAAGKSFADASSISQAIGHAFVTKLATMGLGDVQASENRLFQAAETYRHVLEMFGDQPLPIAGEAHLNLAKIYYEWNDLDAAVRHGLESLRLARQYAYVIDRFVVCEVFLARMMLTRGDTAGAADILTNASQSVEQYNFVLREPDVAAVQVLTMLRQGNLAAAAELAETHDLPLSQARVYLAQGEAAKALEVLEPYRRQVESRDWEDEKLKVMVLQTVALQEHGEIDQAMQLLSETLTLAEPCGFIRTFIDEGDSMEQLLSEAAARGIMPDYAGKLLAAFKVGEQNREDRSDLSNTALAQPLDEPLSERELEVLGLIAQGLSNRQICQRLFLALSTVKGHNRIIFGKLGVQRRTEAVARARELGLL